MHALVTGASGFLGGRLMEMLGSEGVQVTALVRPLARIGEKPGVKVVRGGLEAGFPGESFRMVTHIFHCAGCSTDWAPDQAYRDGNIGYTKALLDVARRAAPKLSRFLHVSTTDVYGYPASAGDETTPLRDIGLPYNSTKLRGETLVWESGLPVTVVRPASIYGPGGKAFVTDIAALLRQRSMLLVDGGRVPGGFVYVDDVCRAMLLAAVEPRAEGEVYNLSSMDGTTWRAYTAALAGALTLPAPWLRLPFAAAMTLAKASELPHKAGLRGRPLLTRHAVYLLGRDQQYITAKARKELGWTPRVELEEGMARSVAPILELSRKDIR